VLFSSYPKTCILRDINTDKTIHTLIGHSDIVNAHDITPDGERAISGSFDHNCILWNLDSYEELPQKNGHTFFVDSIAISADGKKAISGSWDTTCILWDINTSQPEQTLNGHTNFVKSVALTSDGKRALSGSKDNTCILWNLCTGQVEQQMTEHTDCVNSVALTPCGKLAFSGSYDKSCILWDLSTGNQIRKFTGHTDKVMSVAITPDGKLALSGSMDNTCILWNLRTNKISQTLKGHKSAVFAIAITPDGRKAFTGSMDSTCILWDLNTGHIIRVYKGHSWGIKSVAISADGKRALSGSWDQSCILWDLSTGKQLTRVVVNTFVNAVTFKTNRMLLGTGSGEVIILDVDRGLLNSGKPVITINQIWDFELKQYLSPLAVCPSCGHRFSSPISVIDTIEKITCDAGLKPKQSPCLELPDKYWLDPGLLSNCPKCGEGLKFNPFMVLDPEEEKKKNKAEEERKFADLYEKAETAFSDGNWDTAFKLYLKLIQAEQFDENYMNYNMAICRINTLTTNDPKIIANIDVLIRLLREKGKNEEAQLISDKLKERLDAIMPKKSWWKKMF